MRFRLGQLKLAAFLAVGFVFVRLIYAIIFGGAAQGRDVLFEIPAMQLAGPFSHIQLFGPVTFEGLYQNLLLALPFAAVIFLTGVFGGLLTPGVIFAFARKFPRFRNLLTAIALGWVQLPALQTAIQRLNYAMTLRGERRYRLVIPVLETAIARALATAQRLVFQSLKPADGETLSANGLCINPGQLGPIDLEISGGLTVITGATGSGKSTLLLALSGLGGELGLDLSGSVATPARIGFVPQNPRDSLWGPTVYDEIPNLVGFGLESKGSLAVATLSEGEAAQVAILREFAREPELLLLDEPFAGLDDTASIELLKLIELATKNGTAVIVVEHRPELLASLDPQYLMLDSGRLVPGIWKPQLSVGHRSPMLVGSDIVLDFKLEELKVGDKTLLLEPQLVLRQGQITALTGANGSGKTSFMNTLRTLDSTQTVRMVPELFTDFFVTTSTSEELERADLIAHVEPGYTLQNLKAILGERLPKLDTHPRDLSAGIQLALAIAMQMSHRPQVLLIDEPVRGFDPLLRSQVAETLRCVQETGCSVVLATHDLRFVTGLSQQLFRIYGQRLVPLSEVRA
ncbi:MAG: hypothetical protein RL068_180 [Actinomycetota bacterium]|jgi:energy-coupling factor transport system ATP-binding protein